MVRGCLGALLFALVSAFSIQSDTSAAQTHSGATSAYIDSQSKTRSSRRLQMNYGPLADINRFISRYQQSQLSATSSSKMAVFNDEPKVTTVRYPTQPNYIPYYYYNPLTKETTQEGQNNKQASGTNGGPVFRRYPTSLQEAERIAPCIQVTHVPLCVSQQFSRFTEA